MNRKNFLLISGLVSLVILLLLLITLGIYLATRPVINGNNNENPPSSYQQPPVSNTLEEQTVNKEIKIYTNSNLPGLALKYPDSWQVFHKEFSDSDSKGFQSKYFPTCDNNCMGLKFSKNDVNLNIIFDLALDDSGKKCSNTVTFKQIGNNWMRVKDSTGYFYTKNYQLNVTTKPEEPFNLDTSNDEWSLLNNTNYQICVNGTRYF